MSAATLAITSGELTDLVSSSGSATIHPSEDTILSILQSRFRADLPYTRVGASTLIVVNPLKAIASTSDASANEYKERCYDDTSLPTAGSPKVLQPHAYELACRVYLLMCRRKESQSVLFHGITGSGKTSTSNLLVDQILRLSTGSKKEARLGEQIKALYTLLDAFGNSKTPVNASASGHGRYLELHFNDIGRIASAKVLAYALDKSRLARLSTEERSFHVFYQLLAGAGREEREHWMLEDPSEYSLLASSGCYRLPAGPFSDDSVGMDELRAAMRILGFKQKHMTSIFQLLVALLVLTNIQFDEFPSRKGLEKTRTSNPEVLDHAASLLGVSSEELAQCLTNKTSYVRKELFTALLEPQDCASQRDQLVKDLYAILFAYIVESANHRIAPTADAPPFITQIALLDQPGFQSRAPVNMGSISHPSSAPLVSAHGQNGFPQFCANFSDELLHSYVLRHTFEDTVGYNGHIVSDGIALPAVVTMDNASCVELLRGAQLSERAHRKPNGVIGVISRAAGAFKTGKGGDSNTRDSDMLQELSSKFGVHASYVASPGLGGQSDRMLFGINHYAGTCTYDATSFVEKDADLLDSSFVALLRGSNDSFISRLVSGPSISAEIHPADAAIVVQAQVSSRPLRDPSEVLSSSSSPIEPHPQLDPSKTYPVTTQLNYNLSTLFDTMKQTRTWSIICIRPNDSGSPNSFDKRRVKSQIRALLLPNMVSRRKVEYIADLSHDEFCERYVPTMPGDSSQRIRQSAQSNGWREGIDYAVGHRSVWLTYGAWKMAEDILREREAPVRKASDDFVGDEGSVFQDPDDAASSQYPTAGATGFYGGSSEQLVVERDADGMQYRTPNVPYGNGGLNTPNLGAPPEFYSDADNASGWGPDWDKKEVDHSVSPTPEKGGQASDMLLKGGANAVEEIPQTRVRRAWIGFVWFCTWWIPNIALSKIGRMKRPDIQLAWREKLTICLMIAFFCGFIIFYIVEFGRLVCPNFNKAWDPKELATHTADNDFWVAVYGDVYDISHFWKGDHSDIRANPVTPDLMQPLAGQDLTKYFPIPFNLACPGLVDNPTLVYNQYANASTVPQPAQAIHISGPAQTTTGTALNDEHWYTNVFQPKMKGFHKGDLVYNSKMIQSGANDDGRQWAIYNHALYDLSDYLYNINQAVGQESLYQFMNTTITDLFKQQPGQDITKQMNDALATLDPTIAEQNLDCLNNAFYVGRTDFRKTARCQFQNILLIIFSSMIVATIAIKFLSALQLSAKRNPEMLDKFVICQVPCYTEGEESLRRTIDTLSALKYDDKRKLMFLICDGNIIGSGNDRTTPRIVLDILGVDPKLDPEPLLFKSIGEGSKQLNYGKVYSGLYEFEGHVVPYIVVVKTGKPTERTKPGNRGKRDSQILLMHYLNRVHFDLPMTPLELEIYHQMRNVIGIDPAFYEYIFMVDADTSVTPDSLNRLVATTADDSSIIAVCGETKLDNEEGSWWTMIQVYEYYISHHLAKAFESLFGSVTCLPGCFSLYRIRTADKGRPLIISNRVIDDYSENNVDTLHKKNLLSLGEDRYLTTIMMKHFPTFKMKFTPDAIAHTIAPDKLSILISQRRRWINSTVHNLAELVLLPELCGFCCFSMRFIVFIDLVGTIILPATAIYIVYLIIVVATHQAPLPVISLILIGSVYGLQAVIFLLKREFKLIGWLVIYLLAYPIYSFFLPVYSFWCMDDFSWGNTRLVVGEGSSKKVIMNEDEKFDESMIPLKRFSEYEAEAWENGSHRSDDRSRTGYGKGSQRGSPSRPGSAAGTHKEISQDYYRDTNLFNASNPNLQMPSMSNMSQRSGAPPATQFFGPQFPQFGGMPFMMPHFGSAPPSEAGSHHSPMQVPTMGSFSNAGSIYGMPPMGMPSVPRNSVATNLNMFNGSSTGLGGTGMVRPQSTFSMATNVNPFANTAPSNDPSPSDEDLLNVLRQYLATQDLMTVTKKTAREAVQARFPQADLSSKRDFLNQSIDQILSQS